MTSPEMSDDERREILSGVPGFFPKKPLSDFKPIPDFNSMSSDEVDRALDSFIEECSGKATEIGILGAFSLSPKRPTKSSLEDSEVIQDLRREMHRIKEALVLALRKEEEKLDALAGGQNVTNIHIYRDGSVSTSHGAGDTSPSAQYAQAPASSPTAPAQHVHGVELDASSLERVISELETRLKDLGHNDPSIDEQLRILRELHGQLIPQPPPSTPTPEAPGSLNWNTPVEELGLSGIMQDAWKALQAFANENGNIPFQNLVEQLNAHCTGLDWDKTQVNDCASLIQKMRRVTGEKQASFQAACETLRDHFAVDTIGNLLRPKEKIKVLNVLREVQRNPRMVSQVVDILYVLCRNPAMRHQHFNEKVPNILRVRDEEMQERSIQSFLDALLKKSDIDHEGYKDLRAVLQDLFQNYVAVDFRRSNDPDLPSCLPFRIKTGEEVLREGLDELADFFQLLAKKGFKAVPNTFELPIIKDDGQIGLENSTDEIGMYLEKNGDSYAINGSDLDLDTMKNSPIMKTWVSRTIFNLQSIQCLFERTISTGSSGRQQPIYSDDLMKSSGMIQMSAASRSRDADAIFGIRGLFCIPIQSDGVDFDYENFNFTT